MDPNRERLLLATEVAALFKVDPKTVTRWAAQHRIPSIKTLGGHRRYKEGDVLALLNSRALPERDADGYLVEPLERRV